MTLANAKLYVAGILGGTADSGVLDRAAHSIKATAGIWSRKHKWSFLRKTNVNSLITVTADVANYSAPSDFNKPYSARLLTLKQPLKYIQARLWDRAVADHSISGYPWFYTVDNPGGWTASAPGLMLTLFRTPSTDDTLYIRYYRSIDGAADPIDVPDELLYDFLDFARVHLLVGYNSRDARIPMLMADAKSRFAEAIAYDMEESEDEDLSFIAPGWSSASGDSDPTGTDPHGDSFIEGMPV